MGDRPGGLYPLLLVELLAGLVMLFLILVGIGGLLIINSHGTEHDRMVAFVFAEVLVTFAASLLFQRFQLVTRRRRAITDLLLGETSAPSDPAE
jgi:hypothetical protein